tara:strand:- start:6018 stop:8336 length:2319 start_codon:yes stop_codon:yes gene_type:complete
MRKFLAFIISIGVVFSAMASEPYVMDDFSKGLNTKLSAHDIANSNQAVIAENIRFNKELKSLSKRQEVFSYGTADATEAVTSLHRLYLADLSKKLLVTHGDELEVGDDAAGTFSSILDLGSGGYRWQWMTWHNLAMGTDGYNQPVKTDGTDATYLGSCHAADNGGGAGPDGAYTYKISYYTASYEVLLNTASNSITVSDNDIDLTMIPIGPDTYSGEAITGRKIYRTSAGGSDYKLLSNGTIADNSTTTLTDSDTDGARGAAYPAGDATYAPPKGKLIVLHKNRVFIAGDPDNPSRLYYSEDGLHDIFKDDAFFNVRKNDGDSITFIKNLKGLLTVGKNNTIQKLYTKGSDPAADWAVSDPFSFVGCQAPYSADNTPLGIIYLAFDGLYLFNGQNSQLVSDAVTPEINDISPSDFGNCWGIYHKNLFYLAYSSEKTGATANDRILVLDLLGEAYSIDTLGVNAFCAFQSGTDWGTLYSGSSSTGAVFAHTRGNNEVIHRRHSDFTGTWTDMRYIPTTYGEGDAESPVLEIAWTIAIDDAVGTIDTHSYGATAIIDRPNNDGQYISQYLTLGASTFDKLYWNERIPATGGDVQFQLRSGPTTTDCLAATWSTVYTDPTGSDVSAATAGTIVQYKIYTTTDTITYTPTLFKSSDYVVKLLYNKEGASSETAVALNWTSGWMDFNKPAQDKTLETIFVYLDSPAETGFLILTWENFEGDTDVFTIDLGENPEYYTERFTTGKFRGEKFKLNILESSLNDITIKQIIVVFSTEPYV